VAAAGAAIEQALNALETLGDVEALVETVAPTGAQSVMQGFAMERSVRRVAEDVGTALTPPDTPEEAVAQVQADGRLLGVLGTVGLGLLVNRRLPDTNRRGGRYQDVRGANVGGEVHHMPADSASPLSRADGPSIIMSTADHRQTGSWGRSRAAQRYRAQQRQLIEEGRFNDAVQMDIDDVRSRFGDRYDQAILEMMDSVPSD